MLDASNTSLSPRAEALMMAADRAQHMQEVILPAIESGRHVVSDRSVYSSLAYQGYGRGLGPSLIRGFNSWAIQDTWPDLVVYIEVPAEILLERMKKRELDRFEREDRGFFERVAEGFRAMAAAEPYRWLVVDGMPPKDELAATILTQVTELLHLKHT
jgi:dTMP kinase